MSNNLNPISNTKIAIIGLGYVGLPLAVAFAKKYKVLGFDINQNRIEEIKKGEDNTLEVSLEELQNVSHQNGAAENIKNNLVGLNLSCNKEELGTNNIFIITVPTPIDKYKTPNLSSLLEVTEMLGSIIKKDSLVIYESTVYPGCTEEECIPVLEKISGLKLNQDFYVGYSPERINSGDKVHTLTKIKKVTSGSNPETANKVDELYQSIIEAGTHKAPSIKVAEAAKAIENAQRDVNISFVNELAYIFDRLGIDTNDVLEAANTKWNFLNFKPGLVGGHCIGVDPYYLAYKAQSLGYHPQVILSGRRVNDKMGAFVAEKVVKLMIQKDTKIKGAKALILGVTFKENCPDVRNTRVVDIYHELKNFGLAVTIFDPWADKEEVENEYQIKIQNKLEEHIKYDAIILAVAHQEFLVMDLKKIKTNNAVIFDTKACLDRTIVDGRL